MASFTNFLKLLKKNPATDGKDTFNIETMLNENWDKIDKKVEENSSAIGQSMTLVPTPPDLNNFIAINKWCAIAAASEVANVPSTDSSYNNSAVYNFGQNNGTLQQYYYSPQARKTLVRDYVSWYNPKWTPWRTISSVQKGKPLGVNKLGEITEPTEMQLYEAQKIFTDFPTDLAQRGFVYGILKVVIENSYVVYKMVLTTGGVTGIIELTGFRTIGSVGIIWNELPSKSYVDTNFALKNYGSGGEISALLPTGSDILSIKNSNGNYINGTFMGVGLINAPNSGWFLIKQIVHNDIWSILQVVEFNVDGSTWKERRKLNGVWQPEWKEMGSSMKVVQRGEGFFQSGVNNITIPHNNVNLQKSFVVINASGWDGSGSGRVHSSAWLGNRTNTSFTISTTGGQNGVYFSWQIVEFC